jgi:hypothetical protein
MCRPQAATLLLLAAVAATSAHAKVRCDENGCTPHHAGMHDLSATDPVAVTPDPALAAGTTTDRSTANADGVAAGDAAPPPAAAKPDERKAERSRSADPDQR